MRFLPTRLHGIIDYAWAALLTASPYAFGFGGLAATVAIVVGLAGAVYSLLTDYELGAARLLPMRLHLGLDALAGGGLALLPRVLGAAEMPGTGHRPSISR